MTHSEDSLTKREKPHFLIVWEFTARPGKEQLFEAAFGLAMLFRFLQAATSYYLRAQRREKPSTGRSG